MVRRPPKPTLASHQATTTDGHRSPIVEVEGRRSSRSCDTTTNDDTGTPACIDRRIPTTTHGTIESIRQPHTVYVQKRGLISPDAEHLGASRRDNDFEPTLERTGLELRSRRAFPEGIALSRRAFPGGIALSRRVFPKGIALSTLHDTHRVTSTPRGARAPRTHSERTSHHRHTRQLCSSRRRSDKVTDNTTHETPTRLCWTRRSPVV